MAQKSLPTPPEEAAGTVGVDILPTFLSAADGVLPVVLFDGSATSIEFYSSSDGGTTWLPLSQVSTSSEPQQWPMVSVVGVNTWWVVGGVAPEASPTVRVTDDGGHAWASVSSTGLAPNITSLQAANATVAWATVQGTSACGLVGTSDGGRTWQQICPGQ